MFISLIIYKGNFKTKTGSVVCFVIPKFMQYSR